MFVSFNDYEIDKQDCIFYEGSEYFRNSDMINIDYKDYYNYDSKEINKLDDTQLVDYMKFMDYIGNNILLAISIYEYKKRKVDIPIEIEYIDEFIKYTINEIFSKHDNLCKEYIKLLIKKEFKFIDLYPCKSIENAFVYSCVNGHDETAKWILSLNKNIDIHINYDIAFRLSCCNGHKEIAEWLLTIDGKIDIHLWGDITFRESCHYGHKEIAEWLLTIDGKVNIHAQYDGAFRMSCKNGHKEIAEWLLSLDGNISIHAIDDACRESFYYDQKKMVVWLCSLLNGKYEIIDIDSKPIKYKIKY